MSIDETRELINEVKRSLNDFKKKADRMAVNAEYKNGKILDNLSASLERSIDDVRRNTTESDYRM